MNRLFTSILVSTLLVIAWLGTAYAEETKANVTLLQNVKIFDGMNEKLAANMSVLVEGNKIAKIGKSITAPAA